LRYTFIQFKKLNKIKHMHFTKKITITLLIAIVALSGCRKSILNDDDDGLLSNKNIRLNFYAYVGDFLYHPDSLYFLGGAKVKIEDIAIVHSNFFFVNNGDTLPKNPPAVWRLSGSREVYIGYLPPASYTGIYRFLVGLDSATNSKLPANQPAGSPLTSQEFFKGPGKGYDFVVISGKIQDPNNPTAAPSINMRWAIATSGLAIEYGTPKSFNVVPGKSVTFDIILQIDNLFNGLAPIATPIIATDPSNPNDYTLGQLLQANFVNAYKMQI